MISAEFQETEAIVNRLATLLLASLQSAKGHTAALARSSVSLMVSNSRELLDNKEFAAALFANFNAIRTAGGSLAGFTALRTAMTQEAPIYLSGQFVVKMSLLASLSQEARLISSIKYSSRYDIDSISSKIALDYEPVEAIFAEWADPSVYLALLKLHSDLVKHLADVSRPLPQMVNYSLNTSYPSLAMSNLMYASGSRAEELVSENKTVHPAFMPVTGRMLAN